MNRNIYSAIRNEYEKRQKTAFDNLELIKSEIYSKIPRLEELDRKIILTGLKYNRLILTGKSNAEALDDMSRELDMLKNEKQQLLEGAGYSKKILEPAYQCAACSDTGYVRKNSIFEKCTCYKQLLISHLFTQSNLTLAKTENFSTFDESYYSEEINDCKYGIRISPRENIRRIRQRSINFIQNFASPDEKNLFFSGPAGVGKTFMSNCIAMELLNKGVTVLYLTAPMLFNTINEYRKKSFKDDDYEDEMYKEIFEAELLIIDDLGTESPSAARYAEFLNILNTRQINNLSKPCKTIISTNIGTKELYEYYDERNASRIIGCFDMFRFVGEDIRRLKKLAR